MWLDVGDGSGNWFHVKACRAASLGEEFDRFRLARERFQAFTAEPVAHTCLAGWSILIARAVDHTPVQAADLADSGKPASSLMRKLIDFFAAAHSSAKADVARQENETFMREVVAFFSASPEVSVQVRDFARNLDPALWSDLPCISQHGDLVLNNLARASDRLVIFDWEDYGATALAGLDICLLSVSLLGMNAAGAKVIQQTDDPSGRAWEFAYEACAVSGLAYPTFRTLIPVYLLAFRYLKRNYGVEIRARMDDMLVDVLR